MSTTPCDQWIRRYSRHMLRGNRIHQGTAFDADDLAQIGRIAAWQAQPDGRGSDDGYRMWKAKGAMLDALRPAQKHELYGPSLDAAEDYEWAADTCDYAELAMLAYHHGEIARAMSSLTQRQREYVELRFVRGCKKAEIMRHFGYDASLSVWRQARKKLVKQLEHLRDL